MAKLLIVLVALGLFGLIGAREYQTVCAPKQTAGGHGHGHDAGGASHDAEGLVTKICEDGPLIAIKEKLGIGSPPVDKPEMAQVKGHKSDDGHLHGKMKPTAAPEKSETATKDDHGHGHGSGEHGKQESGGAKVQEDKGHGAAGHDHSKQEAPELKDPQDKGHGTAGHEHGKSEKEDGHGHGAESGGEGLVKLSAAQMAAAGIDIAPVSSGTLNKEISVPGRIVINGNLQAKVVPKLPGTVAKVLKQAGDSVFEGEVLATLESRELSDAKGEYLASARSEELAKSTYAREERLWKKKVTAEQDYLNAKTAHQESRIKVDLAHQKLHTIGMSEEEIAALSKTGDDKSFRFYDLKSPIKGRVLARDMISGQIVTTDREVFSLADLSKVWVEMSVSPTDLPFAKEGQDVRIQSGVRTATAKVVAVNPTIDTETRTAKVVAELENAASDWRLGDFVSAQLLSGKLEVNLMVPRDAIQTIKGAKAVFVSDGPGFRMRSVTTGREDTSNVEILSGLEFGETIATKNTFTLKAELGKAEAEHEH